MVVAEARGWIGTRYHPGADVKGAGVDCGMLLVRVFVDTGLAQPFDPRPYSQDWHLHRSDEKYLGFVAPIAREVPHELVKPGDIIVFRWGRCYSHGGIVTDAAAGGLTIVHAFSERRAVVEQRIDSDRILADPRRAPRYFSHWTPRLGS